MHFKSISRTSVASLTIFLNFRCVNHSPPLVRKPPERLTYLHFADYLDCTILQSGNPPIWRDSQRAIRASRWITGVSVVYRCPFIFHSCPLLEGYF
jgi:hypothetical protein